MVIAAVIKSRKQKMKKDMLKEIPPIREKYHEVLCNRMDDKKYEPLVDKFFDSLPQNDD